MLLTRGLLLGSFFEFSCFSFLFSFGVLYFGKQTDWQTATAVWEHHISTELVSVQIVFLRFCS